MPFELVSSNVVIVAQQFNPSVFSQLLLVRNNIVSENGFHRECLFSEMAAHVESDRFSLLVVPPQLQFVPKVAPPDQLEVVVEKVGAIVRSLPHTPYTGAGLNYVWHVWPQEESIHTLSRRLFFLQGTPLFDAFGAPDARFGSYLSMNILGCRLKLDIKPIVQERGDCLQFAFNFHLDVPREPDPAVVTAIEEHLRRWDDAKREADRILQMVTAS